MLFGHNLYLNAMQQIQNWEFYPNFLFICICIILNICAGRMTLLLWFFVYFFFAFIGGNFHASNQKKKTPTKWAQICFCRLTIHRSLIQNQSVISLWISVLKCWTTTQTLELYIKWNTWDTRHIDIDWLLYVWDADKK